MEASTRPAQDIRARERTRPHDVVLYGATGFAGRLVAEELAARYQDHLRWAMAGRNRDKLERLRDELAESFPHVAQVPLIIADSRDRDSLDAMAAQAEVVCTTVGPYAKYGSELVAACVDHGTDYCDLTGEVQWIRRMVDAHHEGAQEAGARIVHCCGFDSIPSDLGTLLVQEHVRAQTGEPCQRVDFFLMGARGGFSGGTVASMINLLEEASQDRQVRRTMGHPYALNPPGERAGPDGSDQSGPRFDEQLGAWTAPFLMAPVNTRIVRRSNALRGYDYGRDFRYHEATRIGDGPLALLIATAFSAGVAAFTGAMMVAPTRALLQRMVLPAPGEGPSRETIESGYFKVRLLGSSPQLDEPVRATVAGQRDPGYGATATMLAESAACLALQGHELDSPGGVLTPASAMGSALLERLRGAGMRFEVD